MENAFPKLRRDELIAVEHENPFCRSVFLQPVEPVSYLLCIARPFVLNKDSSMLSGNGFCSVGAEGIDNEDAVAEGERIKALCKQAFPI